MKLNGNSTRTTWTYDARGRLSMVRRSKADGTLLECITCTYDDAGSRLTQGMDAGMLTTWTYDDSGQLQIE